MNVAFALFKYFPFGGLQRDCVGMARCCAARGHAVTIFTREWEGPGPGPGITVETLGNSGFTNPARNARFVEQLRARLAGGNFAGVAGFNKMPGLDVYYGADPCYATRLAGLPGWKRALPRYRQFAAWEAAVFHRDAPTEVMLITDREIPDYERVYGTGRSRLHLLPPNISRRTVTPEAIAAARAAIRAREGWGAGDRLVLQVGSDFHRKGVDRAIHALARLPLTPVTRLAVVGQDSPRSLPGLARKLGVGDRVHFLGGRHDVPELMLAADVLTHAARSENTGTVLVEAIASGLPQLVTAECGYAFHVQRAGAGLVLPSPFGQSACDAALATLVQGPIETWREPALRYAATEDLYGCHERGADIILQTLAAKAGARR